MKRKILSILLIAVFSIFLHCSALAATSAPGAIASSAEWTLLELINTYRAENGLQPLSMLGGLQKAADTRAAELDKKESTNRPDGSSWATAVAENSVSYNTATQCYMKNLKNSSKAPAQIIAQLRNSTSTAILPFRNAILSGKYTHIGIGSSADGHWLWILTGGGCTLESCTVSSQSGAIYTPGADIDGLSMVASVKCGHGTASLPVSAALCDGAMLRIKTAAGDSVILPDKPEKPTAITMQTEKVTVSKGGSSALAVDISPLAAKANTITWTSSNANIASVNADGRVTGVAAGVCTVTASVGELSASCEVTVVDRAEAIKCDLGALTIGVGQKHKASYSLYPVGCTEPVEWSVYPANSAAVSVAQDGTITAGPKTGKAYVIATTSSGKSARIKVTVVEPEKAVQLVKISAVSAQVAPNNTIRLVAKTYPASASSRAISWVSADSSIAVVDANGIVTGVSKGTTSIYAISSSGIAAECKVTVRDALVAAIRFKKSSASIYVGQTGKLTPAVLPENAPRNSLVWTSSDPSIASVDLNGYVTALKKGNVQITAASGDVSASIDLTVKEHAVSAIKISKRSASVTVGTSGIIRAQIAPAKATNKNVVWTSSNPAVVSVDENGRITALSGGTAVITAASESNPSVKTSCTIRVSANLYKRSAAPYNAGKSSAYVTAAYIRGGTLRVQVCCYNNKSYSVSGNVFGDELLLCTSNGAVAKRIPINPDEMYTGVVPGKAAKYVVYTFSIAEHPELTGLNLHSLHSNTRTG